ncbi:MAG: MlaD family protein [Proteobacteria bacterium]|nr:MlaD family protein [Pseudomonadota bacterium]
MKREISNYFLVVIFTFAITIITIFAMVKMTGKQADAINYHSYYHNVTGLGYGTPVFYEGYRIGQIESITPDFSGKQLRFKILYSVLKQWKIPTDSVAQIQSAGLLADMSINIKGGKASNHHKEGSEISGMPPADLFAQLAAVSDDINDITEDQLKPMLSMLHQRFDSITSQADKALPEILANLNKTTAKLDTLMSSANELLTDENKQNISNILLNLNDVTDQFKNTVTGIDSSIENVNALINDARILVNPENSNVANILKTASQTMYSLSNKLDNITNEIESASMNLNEATNLIRQNPSSLIFSKGAKTEDGEL